MEVEEDREWAGAKANLWEMDVLSSPHLSYYLSVLFA